MKNSTRTKQLFSLHVKLIICVLYLFTYICTEASQTWIVSSNTPSPKVSASLHLQVCIPARKVKQKTNSQTN